MYEAIKVALDPTPRKSVGSSLMLAQPGLHITRP